ncbi:hypothetical protein FV218_10385 [Methylobacterium sp. WL69]|uniref:hypothetical protein n=1 Tax=Methylobacterium sp. WL69 TaxID=2603893 RepID=UPI0011C98813|nr:hypothetical protein [Methylobacterium sp. WL69]TXM74205.1 hypothetical protein FV218_10385 [Methylobacterium sp. WL69]
MAGDPKDKMTKNDQRGHASVSAAQADNRLTLIKLPRLTKVQARRIRRVRNLERDLASSTRCQVAIAGSSDPVVVKS